MVAKLATEELNRSIIIEGVIHIHNKTNPDIMVDFLNAYLPERPTGGGAGRLDDAHASSFRRDARDRWTSGVGTTKIWRRTKPQPAHRCGWSPLRT